MFFFLFQNYRKGLVDLGLLGVGLLKNEVEETLEGGEAQGFNATPFGAFPLNVLVALPNISGRENYNFKSLLV